MTLLMLPNGDFINLSDVCYVQNNSPSEGMSLCAVYLRGGFRFDFSGETASTILLRLRQMSNAGFYLPATP